MYDVKLHLLCATNGLPLSDELTSANVAEVGLTEELLSEANLGREVVRTVLGDLAYRSGPLKSKLTESGGRLVTERAKQHGTRQRIEISLPSLKRVFRLGETLAPPLQVSSPGSQPRLRRTPTPSG